MTHCTLNLPRAPAAHGNEPGSGNTVVPEPGKLKGFGLPLTPLMEVTGFPTMKNVSISAHYSKSQIFVQKFNFDKTPTVFHPNFFSTIFLVKSKLSTTKKSKTTTFSRVFHP